MNLIRRLLFLCAFSMTVLLPSRGAPPEPTAPHFKQDLGVQPTVFGTLHLYEGLWPVHTENPHYPRKEAIARITGTVTMEVLIAADGTVTDARLRKTSGNANLDASALESVRHWKYPVLGTNERYVNVESYTFEIDG